MKKPYHRYHIETKKTPHLLPHPNRFQVKVNRFALAKLLMNEFFHYKGNKEVLLSRPCVYGVFSGPLGGFAPREHLCVGCLRCTTEHPDVVQILHNPERKKLEDLDMTPDQADTIVYEAETGRVPIRGAGYRGRFGGTGWDGMWTDMSEIVRPTRDGIHGREFISTQVDIGERPRSLKFDSQGHMQGLLPRVISAQIPLLFNLATPALQDQKMVCHIFTEGARHLQTYSIMSLESIRQSELSGSHVIPYVDKKEELPFEPAAIEIADWDEDLFQYYQKKYPQAVLIIRVPFTEKKTLVEYCRAGARVFHLIADREGKTANGLFVLDAIRQTNQLFVEAKIREEVTLLGSGGIIAAEHMAKAIICGLDAVVLERPLLTALQIKENTLPPGLNVAWGTQRLKNLAGSWRDQLLEILGAMGLREVRRLRGEIGRALFQKDLEREAFSGIQGYVQR